MFRQQAFSKVSNNTVLKELSTVLLMHGQSGFRGKLLIIQWPKLSHVALLYCIVYVPGALTNDCFCWLLQTHSYNVLLVDCAFSLIFFL